MGMIVICSGINLNLTICVLGPVANTFGDFWRTVWDQGVCVIVMVTNIVEGGRVRIKKG